MPQLSYGKWIKQIGPVSKTPPFGNRGPRDCTVSESNRFPQVQGIGIVWQGCEDPQAEC